MHSPRQNVSLSRPSVVHRRTRRRWILSIYIYILCLLLSSIIYCYRFIPKSNEIERALISSPSVRIMYVIRTSSKFYQNRLIYLLQTWITFVQKHAYFVTDELVTNISENHLLLTKNTCGHEEHTMKMLCCKTAHDFVLFHRYQNKYNWFCHFDDDQYVHTKNLETYLATLDPYIPYYIGRNSWSKPVQRTKSPSPYPFWFATLGAGVCFSRELVNRLQPYTQNISQFSTGCVQENYHDDIYLGFLISAYLNVTLTKNYRFHSHLEKDFYEEKQTFFDTFTKQITFGFRIPRRYPAFLPNLYSNDPYRLRTLHCLLYPYLFECQKRIRQHLFNITE